MPRFRKRRYRKKRTTRKRYKKRKRRIPRLTLGMPRSQMVRLKYSDTISLNPGIAAHDEYVFRANSCFDTDVSSVSGTPHQPRYWDQYTKLYGRYCVVGSKISLKPMGPTSWEDVYATSYGVYKGEDSTILTLGTPPVSADWIDFAEQPSLFGKHRLLKADVGSNRSVTRKFSMKKDLKRKVADDTSSPTGSDPSYQYYFICWAISPDGIDTAAITYMVDIEFIVLFTDLISVPRS